MTGHGRVCGVCGRQYCTRVDVNALVNASDGACEATYVNYLAARRTNQNLWGIGVSRVWALSRDER